MRTVILLTYHDDHGVFYTTGAGSTSVTDESFNINQFTLSEHDAQAAFTHICSCRSRDLATISMVRLSKWPPYPAHSVILYREFNNERP